MLPRVLLLLAGVLLLLLLPMILLLLLPGVLLLLLLHGVLLLLLPRVMRWPWMQRLFRYTLSPLGGMHVSTLGICWNPASWRAGLEDTTPRGHS